MNIELDNATNDYHLWAPLVVSGGRSQGGVYVRTLTKPAQTWDYKPIATAAKGTFSKNVAAMWVKSKATYIRGEKGQRPQNKNVGNVSFFRSESHRCWHACSGFLSRTRPFGIKFDHTDDRLAITCIFLSFWNEFVDDVVNCVRLVLWYCHN